jgi:type II secretory ATPase GspE/PulE/Tfp pilus assembly ATPase PilB-like protein
MAVNEVLRITPELDDMIASGAHRLDMLNYMRGRNFRGMAEDGLDRVRAHDIDLPTLRRAVDLTRLA